MKKLKFEIPYSSVDEIPLDEFRNLHKDYWKFIAEKGLNYKPNICSSITHKILDIRNSCFACEYRLKFAYPRNPCCPLKMFDYNPDDYARGCISPADSPYRKWRNATYGEDRYKYALECANLEWEDRHED